MQDLPANIYSVESVRALDRCAIDEHGIPGYQLMTSAGDAAVAEARRRFPDATRWQVICGSGNNGGDGYVVARLAATHGIIVSVVAMSDPGLLGGDAATAYGDFAAEGGVATMWSGGLDEDADLLVDAMLGSGLERDVSGNYAAAVESINTHPAAVLALDVPTGVSGDSGDILGCATEAAVTVTFVGLKSGLFQGGGNSHSGDIVFAGLGVPDSCFDAVTPEYRRIDQPFYAGNLPRRHRQAHKGDFGHVVVVGGGPGMPGAAVLAGEAALRAGAGRVSVATHAAHASAFVAACPELMAHAITEATDALQIIEKADVIAFGPGLGQSDWARGLFELIKDVDTPCVWDADALNLLAESPAKAVSRVITPHPGEAGTLLGESSAAVQADRREALSGLAARFGGTAVLKGAGTLISSESGPPWLCTSGNPGMAAPGMGDVLTGVIAALLAQGLRPEDAAAVGVEAHARAGDRAAKAGERGLLASELAAELRGVLNP